MKSTTLQVGGMTCTSCTSKIEEAVGRLNGVEKVGADLGSNTVRVSFDEKKTKLASIKKAVRKAGYSVGDAKPKKRSWLSFLSFIVILAAAYILATSVAGFDVPTNLSLAAAVAVGLFTSMHCMGMCGPFVTTYTVNGRNVGFSHHLLYNAGRILTYTLVGALLGSLGSFFVVSNTFRGAVGIVAGGFMILMGLSMLGVGGLRGVRLPFPGFAAKKIKELSSSRRGPLVIGLLNGLIPCGPLQAMQLYALGTGSFFEGAMVMMAFGLGTAPLMLGFGSFLGRLSLGFTQKIFRASSLVIILLGLLILNRGIVYAGGEGIGGLVGSNGVAGEVEIVGGYQIIKMDVTKYGFRPNKLVFMPGVPVKWEIDAKEITYCNKEIIIPDYDIDVKLQKGLNTVTFTPLEDDERIPFSCWMAMMRGVFVGSGTAAELEPAPPAGGSCSGACGGSCGGGCGCGAR